jgi:hypothetical protein
MIYDEAFEVKVDGLSFLAFSRFEPLGQKKSRLRKRWEHHGKTRGKNGRITSKGPADIS